MAKQSSLKRNYVMNVILTGSSFIVPIITFRYVSRTLLPPANGKVQLALSVISYFNMLAQLGIPTYGIRVCAKVRDDRKQLTKTAHELLGISLIMSAVSYILLFAAILFVPKLRAEKLLYHFPADRDLRHVPHGQKSGGLCALRRDQRARRGSLRNF